MPTRGTTTVLALAAVIAVTLVVVSSGAVLVDQPADRLDDEVALQPADDHGYSYLDENDELVVDVTEENPHIDADGVNLRSLTRVDALFYVTYDGDGHADVWIEHEAEAVQFVVDGDPVESEASALRVSPEDDAVPVGVRVDTRVAEYAPGDDLIDGISVHARTVDDPGAEPPPDDPDDDSPAGTQHPPVSVDASTTAERADVSPYTPRDLDEAFRTA